MEKKEIQVERAEQRISQQVFHTRYSYQVFILGIHTGYVVIPWMGLTNVKYPEYMLLSESIG